MNEIYDYLVMLNLKNKDKKVSDSYRLSMDNDKLICKRLDNNYSSFQINTLCSIEKILKQGYFITNISLLLSFKEVLNTYYLSRTDFSGILTGLHNNKTIGYRSFSIVKVGLDDIAKNIMLGKYNVLIDRLFFKLVVVNNQDLLLVSPVTLVVNDATGLCFNYLQGIRSIIIENLDIANKRIGYVTSLTDLFLGCNTVVKIRLDNFDTSHVTDFSRMFAYCVRLKDINVNSINTDNAIFFNSMFMYCCSLTSLNLNHFNIKTVHSFSNMFENCINLENLDIDTWNIENIPYVRKVDMFRTCEKEVLGLL